MKCEWWHQVKLPSVTSHSFYFFFFFFCALLQSFRLLFISAPKERQFFSASPVSAIHPDLPEHLCHIDTLAIYSSRLPAFSLYSSPVRKKIISPPTIYPRVKVDGLGEKPGGCIKLMRKSTNIWCPFRTKFSSFFFGDLLNHFEDFSSLIFGVVSHVSSFFFLLNVRPPSTFCFYVFETFRVFVPLFFTATWESPRTIRFPR